MRRFKLRPARGVGVLLFVCGALLTSGLTLGAMALWEGSTENAGSTFAAGWVHDATAMAATAEGYDIALKWTPGSQGVSAQKLYGVDKGTSETCTSVSEPTLSATLASASTSTYKDESRGTEANDGDWFCYELQGSNGNWLSQGSFEAVQLGLAASKVSSANAKTTCSKAPAPAEKKIDCNDTITIAFNQKPVLPTSPIDVCVFSSGTIVIGDTETEVVSKKTVPACKTASDPHTVGTLTVAGATVSSSLKFTTSEYTLAEVSGVWTMTITLKGSTTAATVTGSPTWTLTPVSSIKSSIKTHEAVICVAEKSTCRPTTTSDF